ncbi:hypothetical protein [Brevibacterium spongiae]|uniref:Uncharacterized protein n=1 Tax=Brevibacterium spongiae TaxID=2909672 RepID=A0ABY5SK99_9MICO|nr:hypothetical protein [Brevibacterium spongiae]UVI34705.1 hypothetical protein L1F31_11230 [Brevibacterium spongiae]
MNTFEALRGELAEAGRVELHYTSGARLLRGLGRFNFSEQRSAQVVVTTEGVWAAVHECPPDGWLWSRIRDVHILKKGPASSVELTIDGTGAADGSRSRIRLPRGLAVGAQDLAMWLASELAARGTPL